MGTKRKDGFQCTWRCLKCHHSTLESIDRWRPKFPENYSVSVTCSHCGVEQVLWLRLSVHSADRDPYWLHE